ncbi:MAG: sugar phosphorylase [Chloroflexi bacterium]|nr:MAG: sugar phosphorylase [Chloroflexota bacterium]
MTEIIERQIIDHLTFLYGTERAPHLWERLSALLADFVRRHPELRENVPPPAERLTERDVILITYGDQVTESGKPPLRALAEVLEKHVQVAITGIHILPFFPYSSDDGFSVIDYTRVNPDLGDWADIERLGHTFRLMFDAVINHISRQSSWFQAFLAGDPEFAKSFIVVEPGTNLSQVVRPRALPLLTAVQTVSGEKLVWTTFSTDQIDLNYADPDVLLRVIEVLLLYVEKGAELIRLDAIAYLWKKLGTSCIHLEETHRVVKLFRAVLDIVAPGVMLITETNVPHKENISYFGNGRDEAQLVYQFPLPPLVLHTLVTGDATRLSAWAAELALPSDQTPFYNFLASHDGIGVRPVEGILTPEEVQVLVDRTLAHGGYVSCKTNADGSESVYELNISYFDALSDPQGGEAQGVQARRFMVSQAIMLALQGMPAIYVHSLFGSRNYREGVAQTGRYRSINREKFRRADLEAALADPASLRHQVFYPYLQLLRARAAHPAFHPNGPQRVLNLHPAVFAVLRTAPDGSEALLCLHNVTNTEVAISPEQRGVLRDIVTGATFHLPDGGGTLTLAPYQVLWLSVD